MGGNIAGLGFAWNNVLGNLLGLPATCTQQPCACSCPKAYVFLGSTTSDSILPDWGHRSELKSAAITMYSKFVYRNYCTTIYMEATSAQFFAALKDDCTQAIAFIGEGGGVGAPALVFTDKLILPSEITPNKRGRCLQYAFLGACASTTKFNSPLLKPMSFPDALKPAQVVGFSQSVPDYKITELARVQEVIGWSTCCQS